MSIKCITPQHSNSMFHIIFVYIISSSVCIANFYLFVISIFMFIPHFPSNRFTSHTCMSFFLYTSFDSFFITADVKACSLPYFLYCAVGVKPLPVCAVSTTQTTCPHSSPMHTLPTTVIKQIWKFRFYWSVYIILLIAYMK